jgi:hypothetical protein
VSYLAALTGLRIATCIAWTRSTIGTGGLLRSAWDPMLDERYCEVIARRLAQDSLFAEVVE